MFAVSLILAPFLLTRPLLGAIPPANCYNFLSDAGPAHDECGSGPSFSPIGIHHSLTLAGNGGSPHCDQSGCVLEQNSSFQASFPTGVSLDWTLALWTVIDGPWQTFFTINVRSQSLRYPLTPRLTWSSERPQTPFSSKLQQAPTLRAFLQTPGATNNGPSSTAHLALQTQFTGF